jgi:hypothetical protein
MICDCDVSYWIEDMFELRTFAIANLIKKLLKYNK